MVKWKRIFLSLKEGQKKFGECISSIINFLTLSFVYFLGIGTTSLVARLFKKRFIELKPNNCKETYWEESNLGKEKLNEYFRQF